MSKQNSSKDIIKGITLFDIKSYLKSRGWIESDHRNTKLSVLQGPKNDFGKPVELLLPRYDTFLDVSARIRDAFRLISNLYEIGPVKLAEKLKGLNRDMFFVRLTARDQILDSIPLNLAKKEVNGIRNLFVYSACSEKKPLPHYETPLDIGQDVVKKIRFGHTFQGSFGFAVETPVIAEFKQQDLFDQPLERRVVERVVRGLQHMRVAKEKNDPDIMVSSYEKGFNSKMCDAIIEMGESLETPVEFSVQWATNLPPAIDVVDFEPYLLDENSISYLKYASERLKEIPPTDITIVGKVTTLQSNDPADEQGKRIVIIKYRHEDYGLINVKINLGVNQYLNAIEAHKSRATIEITGKLKRKGNVWSLVAISSFTTQVT